jgi:hypothetical protein
LGLQFVGLEQDAPGRATVTEIAEFVKELRRYGQISNDAGNAD